MEIKYPKKRVREPKRQKGYYRALKRGEHWALMRRARAKLVGQIFKEVWMSRVEEAIPEGMKMIGLSEQLKTTSESTSE